MNRVVVAAVVAVALVAGVIIGFVLDSEPPAAVSSTTQPIQPPTIDLAPNPGEPAPATVSIPLSANEKGLIERGYALTDIIAYPQERELPTMSTRWLYDGTEMDVELDVFNGRLGIVSEPGGLEQCHFPLELSPNLDQLLAAGPQAVTQASEGWKNYTKKAKDGDLEGTEVVTVDGTPVTFTCFHSMSG